MNWSRGLFRLWVVLTVLWIGAAASLAVFLQLPLWADLRLVADAATGTRAVVAPLHPCSASSPYCQLWQRNEAGELLTPPCKSGAATCEPWERDWSANPINREIRIAAFRKDNPEYRSLSDEQLLTAIRKRFYAELNWEDFIARVNTPMEWWLLTPEVQFVLTQERSNALTPERRAALKEARARKLMPPEGIIDVELPNGQRVGFDARLSKTLIEETIKAVPDYMPAADGLPVAKGRLVIASLFAFGPPIGVLLLGSLGVWVARGFRK